MSNALPSDRAYLTEEGWRLLEDCVNVLASVVDELHDVLDDPERSSDHIEEYQRAAQELAGLRSLLDSAGAFDGIPDDPRVVELGDTVTIRLDDGTEEAYIVVHAAEASMDEQRISVNRRSGRHCWGSTSAPPSRSEVPIGSTGARSSVPTAPRHIGSHGSHGLSEANGVTAAIATMGLTKRFGELTAVADLDLQGAAG